MGSDTSDADEKPVMESMSVEPFRHFLTVGKWLKVLSRRFRYHTHARRTDAEILNDLPLGVFRDGEYQVRLSDGHALFQLPEQLKLLVWEDKRRMVIGYNVVKSHDHFRAINDGKIRIYRRKEK